MKNEMSVLELILHGRVVGHLAGFSHGRNVLIFTDEFRDDPHRSTLGLITHPAFPNSSKLLGQPWARNQKLHPLLSNLLPEGALRELLAQSLKTHVDNEFQIFSSLGQDLPGALIANLLPPEEIPKHVLDAHGDAKLISLNMPAYGNKFSLAGVQMKFSMKERDGRYNLTTGSELGDWIVKTPSTKYKQVPVNEFTAMSLAALAGIDTPEIKLIEMDRLSALPQINLPDEKLAYAIKRFDRDGETRIHMEDFAQVFVKYAHEKYDAANYEQIGRILFQYSANGLADVQQFAKRLLVNILLANGDAHLKNWSLIYPDRFMPSLSPAYDIVFTRAYIPNEAGFALNLARTKEWYTVTTAHFQRWSEKCGVSWRAIKPHLDEVMERARTLWPSALSELPMDEVHKADLKAHWGRLEADFRVEI
ncbi:MAG: type II toxin-antitoxin system HipA family toxin [Limnobacter sp.]|uniref:type II toxin-antitoxin system HipA family toxin n=1 Tax=Limnobacter sp. TaxID=2003368 RepID=UPI003002B4CB